MTFEEKLREYARLAVRAGIAVRPGQEVLILAPLETAPFVRLCAREAYAAGAKDVVVEWSDDELTRLHYDLSINIEGIDVIHNLLRRMRLMEQELSVLRRQLGAEPFCAEDFFEEW